MLLRLRLATVESEKKEMLHEVRQLRKMGQAGDLPRDLVSSPLVNSEKTMHFKSSSYMAMPGELKKKTLFS